LYLDYIVATHEHEDHVGGLAGALNLANVGTVYCPVTSADTTAFSNFTNALAKLGKKITVPTPGTTFKLGDATVTILAPLSMEHDTNNNSIVLRITYGETSFLFTGDMERDEEQDILNSGRDISSTVLKVGHHGSENGSTYPFLREVMPKYAVISVGAGNSYGHPTDAVLSRLRDSGAEILRTDLVGDIIFRSNGKTVTYTTSKSGNSATSAPQEEEKAESYIINTNSKKFHYPTCGSVSQMSEKNKQSYTGSKSQLLAEGYSPCGTCKP
ncbi:MAG: MBL fold metallo-hydrolase, partial [Oscillospiraceae bacterium]|nr:MBL fold metallo-hydrolase [Oscillospiraceae bacterium]